MKMVSAAKYQIADKELKPARTYGIGAQSKRLFKWLTVPWQGNIVFSIALFDKAEVVDEARKPKHLIIAISSDRGLCGSIHSNVAKNIRGIMAARGTDNYAQVVCVGDKIRTIMQRFFRGSIMMHFTNIGKKPPIFAEASFIAQEILNTGYDYESAEIVFNKFRYICWFCSHCFTCILVGMSSPTVQKTRCWYHTQVSPNQVRTTFLIICTLGIWVWPMTGELVILARWPWQI